MLTKKNICAFTIVELIVAITILGIILVAVMSIFIETTDMSYKIDINRTMQENVKSMVETISEDIRRNGINICDGGIDCNDFSAAPGNTLEFDTLYVGGNKYYVAQKTVLGTWVKVTDFVSQCSQPDSECVLVKNGSLKLSNSFVNISSLSFYITKRNISTLTIHFVMKPRAGKGVKTNLIKGSEMIFQTTISERTIKTN